MRKLFSNIFYTTISALCCIVLFSCNTTKHATNLSATPMPAQHFVVKVEPYKPKISLPGIQSCAWAISNNYLLLIGGRDEGFHGLPQNDTVFRTRKANTSVWVIDLTDFSYVSTPLNTTDTSLFQLFASDFEFCEDADTLYIAGGYGIQNATDPQSNSTFARMTVIQVSNMISQVKMQDSGNVKSAIVNTIYSPVLQVTGGAMAKRNGMFYLMFGQNYSQVYQPAVNGAYTNSITQFQLSGNQLVNANSYTDSTMLHRRDLTVAPIAQNNNLLYAGFGGVFTADDDGYKNPVYIQPNGNTFTVQQDSIEQKTNQYECANAVVFDPATNTCTNILFGGIGKYQYDTAHKKWGSENNDKLPFVQYITQMIYSNGSMHQHVQMAPLEPQMPGFIGAGAIFIPAPGIADMHGIINYAALKQKRNFIGYIIGGIKSIKPTSSLLYPTSANTKLYTVSIIKQSE